MRIGLIGAGRIGGTLARLAVAQGYDVVVSNSRRPETLRDLVDLLGPRASAASASEAGAAGEIVVVSVPLKSYLDVPVDELAGKTVIDTNNYYPDRDGRFPSLDDGSTTSSELLAAHLPNSHVVKAFNTIYFQHLATQGLPAHERGRRALPIAGDDASAKEVVSTLIDKFGFDVVDAGALSEGRRFQPGAAAYNVAQDVEELRAALAAAG